MEVTAAVSFGAYRQGKIYEVDATTELVQSLLRNGYLVDNGFTEADLATEYELATGGVVDERSVLVSGGLALLGSGSGVEPVRRVRVASGEDVPEVKVVKRRGKDRAGSEDGGDTADRTGDAAGDPDDSQDR